LRNPVILPQDRLQSEPQTLAYAATAPTRNAGAAANAIWRANATCPITPHHALPKRY
jgi:hypothetical protein